MPRSGKVALASQGQSPPEPAVTEGDGKTMSAVANLDAAGVAGQETGGGDYDYD